MEATTRNGGDISDEESCHTIGTVSVCMFVCNVLSVCMLVFFILSCQEDRIKPYAHTMIDTTS